ncbi:MAG: hypothetical protein IIW53_04700 [Rikenellaceae bacterium]|nr:hypothetical protein [Rikenellaceae bacterium]MBQ5371434.1 hypothetical protein [Rikenellaceae bacterium]MBQ5853375.1 hypothetical protein [Rikenellaceae bacterium]
MILKFEIDVAEIWAEDGNVNDAIISEIKAAVSNRVRERVITQYRSELLEKLEKEVAEQVKVEAKAIVEDMVENGAKCKKPYSNEELTIKDYISQTLLSSSGMSNVRDIVISHANKIGDELKRRYDLQFAATLIQKMQDNNMLREDIAQLLLNK